MVLSRRGSGSLTLPTGQTLTIHTRTQDEEDLPHATKKWSRCGYISFLQYILTGYCVFIISGLWQIISGNTRACEYMTKEPRYGLLIFCHPRFTLTPQRMRMIVEAFKDTLEAGLEKSGQIVVSICFFLLQLAPGVGQLLNFRITIAYFSSYAKFIS